MFLIDELLANSILNYLALRPWVEVDKFINGLKGLKKMPVVPEVQPESKESIAP